MGFWSSLANAGKKGVRLITYPIRHPAQSLQAGGTAVKTAAVGGTVGYVSWQALVNDKPMARTVSDLAIGEENVNKITNTVGGAVDGVASVTKQASDTLSGVNNALEQNQGVMAGMGNFMQSICSGNGVDMIGDFFRNIGKGNVSGMSFAGLLGAAVLIFGRFGWIGKILGAVLGMMILGNNIDISRVMGGKAQAPQQELPENNQENSSVHRGR